MDKPQSSSSNQQAGAPRKLRRGCLRGCLITLAVLLVLGGVGWYFVRNHLGDMLAGIVREQADKALNGRLEFANLDIDLAGRAVLADAQVFLEGTDEPVFTARRVIVSFDPINFIGPNRGRRAITVTLQEPVIDLVREPDGDVNVARLAKEPEQEKEPQQLGISINIRQAKVNFTDWCLLSQSYPKIPDPGGLAGEILTSLGYSQSGPAEQFAHQEQLLVNGSVQINTERNELALDVGVERGEPGGKLRARGNAILDGSEFDMRATARGLELASLKRYANALFPKLAIGLASEEPLALPEPYAAGRIGSASVRLIQRPGGKLQIDAAAMLEDVRAAVPQLPQVYIPRVDGGYEPNPQVVSGNLTLMALGAELSGSGSFGIDSEELSGSFKLEDADLAKVLTEFGMADIPLSGSVSADITAGGTLAAPQVTAQLSSTQLAADQLNLGSLQGKVALEGSELSVDKVRLDGGDVPLRAGGSLNLDSQSGSIQTTAGPLTVKDALALAGKLGSGGSVPEINASGSFQASADITLAGGKPQASLRVWSEQILYEGMALKAIDIKGEANPPNINLDAAEMTLTLAQPVNAAGFASDGLLKAGIRVGGSISLQEGGKPPVLSLVGSARTRNLAPEQASVSYKVLGPVDNPEIRAQLKTENDANPLVAHATLSLDLDGNSPLSASLEWYDTKVSYNGAINPKRQSISGKLSADKVDLGRIAGDYGISGRISASADVGGTFKQPTVSGSVSLPLLAYTVPQRTYQLSDAHLDFRLAEGNTISVSDGGFEFAGNSFDISGTLGTAAGDLAITSESFNLFSVIALALDATPAGGKSAPSRPPLDIESSGPLSVRLSGALDDPQAEVEYYSGEGWIEGNRYSEARLKATADMTSAKVTQFLIKSPTGQVSASGSAIYEPLGWQVSASLEDFDIGVITPLAGVDALRQLSGRLNGSASVSGDASRFNADGAIQLDGGSYEGIDIETARAEFRTRGKAVEITSATVRAAGTELTASGTVGADPADTSFTASAPRIELALLNPLLPDSVPEVGGIVQLFATLNPGSGKFPQVEVELKDNGGGVTLAGRKLASINVKTSLKKDVLRIDRGDIDIAGSLLRLAGTLDFAGERRVGGKPSYPLDFAVSTTRLGIGDVLSAVPAQYTQAVPPGLGGWITSDLHISGMTHDPGLQGSVQFDVDLSAVEQAQGLGLTGVAGGIAFENNEFKELDIQLRATEGSGLGAARITGSGELALNPPRLTPGSAIDIILAPAGAYTKLNASNPSFGGYDGTLGGTVHVRGSDDTELMAIISGNVVLNAAQEKSRIDFKIPEQGSRGEGQAAPFRFGSRGTATGLQINILPVTEVSGPMDLRANLQGSLTLTGRPGIKEGQDKFEIQGDLDLPEGSLFVYRHTIRLDKAARNFLTFRGDGFFPYFTGRGVIVLPNAMSASDTGAAQTTTGIQTTQIGSGRDLTIFFSFDRVYLGLDKDSLMNEIDLTSQPPMSEDKILSHLVGGAAELMAGHGDFGDIAEGELVGFGTSFISREIERMFDLQAFRLGKGEGGSYYTYLEKELTDDVSLTYYKDFFSDTNQKEQWGVRYQIYDLTQGQRYENLSLNVNFTDRGYGGSGSEFMFEWNTRF